ncbi:hypothetical protein [Bradyrhizobium sp. cf659]|uniref:hypothetical protein n=1 Tax=Bradyrhizobium sp. cf659 TaxID=1761771 RepID=UPI0008EA9D51|nr:hypothetical protein [Bradyrhizobium sp. cf659]SFH70004.1 hypothetical protein SAMN04487925_10166 [Bradyrhizobium sp. cf659]
MIKDIAIAAQSEWLHPEADWLAIEQAPYFFSPAYVRPGADFFAFVEHRARAHALSDVVQLSDRSVALHRGQARLTIDGYAGEMRLEHATPFQYLTLDGSDVDYQSVFYAEAAEHEEISPEHRQSVLDLASFAMRFRRDQQQHFLTALQQREALVVGRWHSVTDPFRPVQYDQWLHFRFNPSTRIAQSEGGDALIYSPMVLPIEQNLSPKQQAEKAVLDWLVDFMHRTSERPVQKEKIRVEAQNRWHDLSDRAFFKIWDRAISQSGVETYGRPGRPKKIIATSS